MVNNEPYSNYELTSINLWSDDVHLTFTSTKQFLKEDEFGNKRYWKNFVTVHHEMIKDLIPYDDDGCAGLIGIHNFWHNFNLQDLVDEIKRFNKCIDINKYLMTGSKTV